MAERILWNVVVRSLVEIGWSLPDFVKITQQTAGHFTWKPSEVSLSDNCLLPTVTAEKKRLNYVFCGGYVSQMARRSKDGSPSWYVAPALASARWRELDINVAAAVWRKGLRVWTAFPWLRHCCEHGDELWGSINGRNLYKIWDVKPCHLASGLRGLLDTEGNAIFRNVGNCLPSDAV